MVETMKTIKLCGEEKCCPELLLLNNAVIAAMLKDGEVEILLTKEQTLTLRDVLNKEFPPNE